MADGPGRKLTRLGGIPGPRGVLGVRLPRAQMEQ